ncbi:rRNA-processing protein UTP11 KNAG_0A06550 [Huiozyma naganishii CBS 8797]|uniref:U3 small nucleolar RNA-associated protein 11 n=1 Tax=Huiozyma naganishii (strain ATCC MYA-139 / BCRC 22969 / CBS 8797 / KCTC 17520 / NBRC 10181 / NCYC 3082 / Yp74L-3) TaxID=1071383 RepID=J7RU28_HUIN7|nr:hypothetical protein KNAG_0A06550 [Kazachstania naganishii CBS 8797]CCK68312.1 hypothetical protein KNAG_0A06550 [Kazachstania naganishii CBS 8797]
MAKLVHDVQKKQHRERSQLAGRARLGFLEKHKDYVKRAQDFHKKQNTLKILRGKTKERNPDEYYHAMNTRKVDSKGLLIASRHGDLETSLSMEQVKLLKTQDSNYMRTLRLIESNKAQKKQDELMFQANGKHTVFVEEKDQLQNFKPEEFFNTSKDMLERRENRLNNEQLSANLQNVQSTGAESIMPKASLDKKKLKKFKIVKQHLEREKQMKEVEQRMELQKEVMKKGSKKKVVDSKGNISFKWKKQRKR